MGCMANKTMGRRCDRVSKQIPNGGAGREETSGETERSGVATQMWDDGRECGAGMSEGANRDSGGW